MLDDVQVWAPVQIPDGAVDEVLPVGHDVVCVGEMLRAEACVDQDTEEILVGGRRGIVNGNLDVRCVAFRVAHVGFEARFIELWEVWFFAGG